MDAPTVPFPTTPVPVSSGAPRMAPAPDRVAGGHWAASTWISLLAGFLTPFTVSVVGEMPVGEFVLIAAAAWAALCVLINRAWPGPLIGRPLLWGLLAAQLVALGAYIGSDIYRHSSPHDMARGWGRMVFLAIDVVAIAYLFGCARRNLVALVLGDSLGNLASLLLVGPMFGDLWKFGVGAPITFFIFLLAPLAGPLVAFIAATGMGVVHFALDYRSYGGLCLIAGMVTLLQTASPRFRLWLAPLLAGVTVASVVWIYQETQSAGRATRSDIERAAMITAATEAVRSSPLIGHGSWFSNSDVYDNFMLIRHEAAKRQHVGGFAHPNQTPDAMALHSQLLVALAEGGLFGATFFIVFGAGLLWALGHTIFVQRWHRLVPLQTLLLLSALWNLLFSPFSGAHRIAIAMACGLILLLRAEAAPSQPTDNASP
jgi:hypothetical protein